MFSFSLIHIFQLCPPYSKERIPSYFLVASALKMAAVGSSKTLEASSSPEDHSTIRMA
jgi:hypothetical protein